MDGNSAIDRDRGMAALDATREADAAGRVVIVHYECGMIGEGEAVPVHAIAVKDPVANRTETFLARGDEAEALARFARFARSHEDWCWLHWHMRNAAYGFEHIQERLGRVCESKRFTMPENRPDLGLVCWQVYGDMPHSKRRKLYGLCDANSVTTANALAGSDIQRKVKAGHWAAVEASVVRKVEMIQAIWSRMRDGSLRPVQSDSGLDEDGRKLSADVGQPDEVNAPANGGGGGKAKSKNSRGRPKLARERAKKYRTWNRAWQRGKHKTYAECASDFGPYVTADDIKNAVTWCRKNTSRSKCRPG